MTMALNLHHVARRSERADLQLLAEGEPRGNATRQRWQALIANADANGLDVVVWTDHEIGFMSVHGYKRPATQKSTWGLQLSPKGTQDTVFNHDEDGALRLGSTPRSAFHRAMQAAEEHLRGLTPDPATEVPDDLEDMHRRGKLGPSLPITSSPAAGIPPATAPAPQRCNIWGDGGDINPHSVFRCKTHKVGGIPRLPPGKGYPKTCPTGDAERAAYKAAKRA